MSRVCTVASTTTDRQRSVQQGTDQSVRHALSGMRSSRPAVACSGLYRGLMLLGGRRERGRLAHQDDVIKALDRRKDAEGPGGRGRNGARSASCSHEHVHRPGQQTAASDRQGTRGSSIRKEKMVPRSLKAAAARRQLIASSKT